MSRSNSFSKSIKICLSFPSLSSSFLRKAEIPVPQSTARLGQLLQEKEAFSFYPAANFHQTFFRTFMPRFSLVSGQKQAQASVCNLSHKIPVNRPIMSATSHGVPVLAKKKRGKSKEGERNRYTHICTYIYIYIVNMNKSKNIFNTDACTCPYEIVYVLLYIYIYFYVNTKAYIIYLYIYMYIYIFEKKCLYIYICM